MTAPDRLRVGIVLGFMLGGLFVWLLANIHATGRE